MENTTQEWLVAVTATIETRVRAVTENSAKVA